MEKVKLNNTIVMNGKYPKTYGFFICSPLTFNLSTMYHIEMLECSASS